MKNKVLVIKRVAEKLYENNTNEAITILNNEYPFSHIDTEKRTYTIKQKMDQFRKDGFIDRYSGDKLLNPGILKVVSYYLPNDFPYHQHWKVSESHIAYWELSPTIDHVIPVSAGGKDVTENWVTTSMLHNSIKSNWSLEQLQWKLYPAGSLDEWDGLTDLFLKMVESNDKLLEDNYIKNWYKVSTEGC